MAAFEVVNFGRDQPEAASNDGMDLLAIELLAVCGVVRDVPERNRHLSPLAFHRRAQAQDLHGKMTGDIGKKRLAEQAVGRARLCVCGFDRGSVERDKVIPARAAEPRARRHGRAAVRDISIQAAFHTARRSALR
jgi:hypothetical protein